jgi:2-polyprenyl-3-methyl-5-hydroxy-6-metoxy-1,4-benzoquinol methylase
MKESSYGILKRLGFIEAQIERMFRAKGAGRIDILDIGCGTGEYLTIPLAQHSKGKTQIFAYDTDEASLSYLLDVVDKRRLDNISIVLEPSSLALRKYDLIILSEVIEHIPQPLPYLRHVLSLLDETGRIIITLPNGYGYFEIENMIEGMLVILGIIPLIKQMKRFFRERSRSSAGDFDTLAVSPHVGFYAYEQARALFSDAGLSIEDYEGRVFACGFFISRIIERSPSLTKLNSFLGSHLPPSLVSGWMFILRPDYSTERPLIPASAFRSNWYTSIKHIINKKRQAIHQKSLAEILVPQLHSWLSSL